MQKEDLVYIGHMLDLARAASAKVAGISRADYDKDENLRLALAYLIQTIGEAARQVSEEFRDRHAQLPWRKITGTRHHIVHDYLNVDFDIIWDVVRVDLPPLIAELETLLPAARGGGPASPPKERLRFTGEWPPLRLWAQYPNWKHAYDEEGLPGQDETTLKPSEERRYIEADVACTAGDAILADGRKLPALLYLMGRPSGVVVFVSNTEAWSLAYDSSVDAWQPATADDSAPAVSLDDPALFPMVVASRLPRERLQGPPWCLKIHRDGSEGGAETGR